MIISSIYHILLSTILKPSRALFVFYCLLFISISSVSHSGGYLSKLPVWQPSDIHASTSLGLAKIKDLNAGTRVTGIYLNGEECLMSQYNPHPDSCETMIQNSNTLDVEDLTFSIEHVPVGGLLIDTWDKSLTVAIGGTVETNWLTSYQAVVKGEAVCIESYLRGSKHVKYGVLYEGSYYRSSDTNPGNYYGPSTSGLTSPFYKNRPDLPYNCIPLPRPKKQEIGLQWNNGFISPVCFGIDPPESRFNRMTIRGGDISRFAANAGISGSVLLPAIAQVGQASQGELVNLSISGKIATCFEETMLGLFDSSNGQSFFDGVKNRARSFVLALLTLYVVIQGFVIISNGGKSLGFKGMMMMILKPVFVMFIIMGPGMAPFVGSLMQLSKELSLAVIDTASGTIDPAQKAGLIGDMDAKKIQYMTALRNYESAKNESPINIYNLSDTGNIISADAIAAKLEMEEAKEEYIQAQSLVNTRGYNYCNFDQVQPPYSNGYEHMKLWDVLDCKLSKYLGIGDNKFDPKSAHLLKIAGALFFVPFAFILALSFVVFVVLITLRVVAVYILSIVAISILVFISPIIVPFILFNFTKYIFDSWVRYIIGFVIQPVIMFGFVTMLFAAYDLAMFGGNHYFMPFNSSVATNDFSNHMCLTVKETGLVSGNSVCSEAAFHETNLSDLTCDDESAVGCIVALGTIKLQKLVIFPVIGVNYVWSFPVFYAHSVGALDDFLLGLLKLNLVSFIGYIMLANIEQAAQTITNSYGVNTNKATPIASPSQIVGTGAAKQQVVASKAFDKATQRR